MGRSGDGRGSLAYTYNPSMAAMIGRIACASFIGDGNVWLGITVIRPPQHASLAPVLLLDVLPVPVLPAVV